MRGKSAGPATERDPAYPVRSLERGLQLLALFRTANRAVRLSEASRALGISPSTTHRMLRVLTSLGFVHQDRRTRAYYAGAALLDQAKSLVHDSDLVRYATPELQALEARTQETALLGVLRGSEAHFIACVESRQTTHAETPPPYHVAPAHATSAGKLLLAQLSLAEVRKIFATSRLFAPRASSIATRGALERELRLIRERGYATSLEEAREGVCTVSTVIRGASGTVYGALTLMCPRQRMPAARIPRLVNELTASAERVALHMDGDVIPGFSRR